VSAAVAAYIIGCVTLNPRLSMPTLLGDGLRVRPFSMADLALVADASTDVYITSITSVPRTFTAETGTAFIERQWGRALSGQGRSWAIARLEDDLGVGQIGLWPESTK
jgi:ribosomal-protein-alanine N-acetyltransferase